MRSARSLFALAFAVSAWAASAQVTLQGRVLDDRSNEPLAFVHVVPEGQREGGTTDIDGRFTVEVPFAPALLRYS